MLTKIRKRDGTLVPFKIDKIRSAIHKTLTAVKKKDGKIAKRLSEHVAKLLEKRFVKKIPSVEDIQDFVEETLIAFKYKKVAKEYADYRRKKAEIRKIREKLRIEKEPKLSVNAMEVLKRRYLLKDEKGNIIETPEQMFKRVAKAIAAVDKKYKNNVKKSEKEFYDVMSKLEFLPNSPTLFNAGTGTNLGLSACYVLSISDSLRSIFDTVKNTALIEQGGGGIGFDFSRLRPEGDIVKSTTGVASGPVSFMRVFDVATDVIKSGGKRRGAMMATLKVNHPDVLKFITVKSRTNTLTNFNLSVIINDDFIDAVKKNRDYELINPRTKKIIKKLNAKKVWNLIIKNAWKSGDPGVIFIDEINKYNPTPEIGKIKATNPCGEQPLFPYESCNLGSINMSRMIKKGKIDWEKLESTIKIAVHFLDNVIDANKFPLKKIEKITKANRKIGLGIMGWAEFLIRLKIPYDSNASLKLAEKVMKFIDLKAKEASSKLAKKRGLFPNFKKSIWAKKYKQLRNATITTMAPTGTISIIAGCSSGIEPLFAISFMRKVIEGTRLFEVNSLFERVAKERGFYSTTLLKKIAETGSVQKIKGIPKDIKKIFKVAFDIKPEYHVKMQAAFQKYTDNAVSKTVNLKNNAGISDVKKAFELAYKLKCKGITIYRYGSKKEQVLNIGVDKYVSSDPEYSGGCPTHYCQF